MKYTYLKKPQLLFVFAALAIIALAFGTCFSPWKGDTGMGTLTINLGINSRLAVSPGEIDFFEHEVTLIGPGGTITRKLPESGAVTFELAQGNWVAVVRATGDTPAGYNIPPGTGPGNTGLFPSRMIRAYGEVTAVIKAGQSSSAVIPMQGAVEVENFAQFAKAVELCTPGHEEIIIINDSFSIGSGFSGFSISNQDMNIRLITEKNVRITMDSGSLTPFFLISDGSLSLGSSGMRGQLIIDGNSCPASLVRLDQGQFFLNDGVTLCNTLCTTTNQSCGVQVNGNGGTFRMAGGSISGNKNLGSGFGGGVNVYAGEFIMTGGTISGNTALYAGGGVYVNMGGTFSKSGGTITGNDVGENQANYAGTGSSGHAAYVASNSTQGGDRLVDRIRNSTARPEINLNSESNDNWE
ncbi:MAG: hypothetical protein FWC45_03660 [Treponema sp.]|nr:hypothetical protein [Treponema sp.]